MQFTKIVLTAALALGGASIARPEIEQGAYLVTVAPIRFATDGKEEAAGNPVSIMRVHDIYGYRSVDFYYGMPTSQFAAGDGHFSKSAVYRTTAEGWDRTPPASVISVINALKLVVTTSGRVDGTKLEGEYDRYRFYWKDDKYEHYDRATHKFRGERIGVETSFVAEGGSEAITEIPYDKPVRMRVRFDRDIPASVQPGYFTYLYVSQAVVRTNSLDRERNIVTFAMSGPREAISQQVYVFTAPGADGVSKLTWEPGERWRVIAPPMTALQLLGADGKYVNLRVVPPPAPVVAGKPPPLEELERPVVRVQPVGTTPSVGPGLDAVVENQPFDINVFVPAASLPKLANGRTPDPAKVPATLTIKIAKENGGDTTLDLRYKGGCLYSTASPITAKDGGGGGAQLAGFDLSTILGSTRLTGGIGALNVGEGGHVVVSYQGEEAVFTVHESGTRLALAAYRAAFQVLSADAQQRLRSGGLSEIEQLALVSPEASPAVKAWLRARTLTADERLALERTVRACAHALTLIDGDFYVRATTKLLIAENYASMIRGGLENKKDEGDAGADMPSRFGFTYINYREAGAVNRAITQALEERSDPLVRLARDVAMGFYQWTLSLTWAGDAVAIGGINPMTGKPLSRAERIMAVINAASSLATQAATTAVRQNAQGEFEVEFVATSGSNGKGAAPVGVRLPTASSSGGAAAEENLSPVHLDELPAAPVPRPFQSSEVADGSRTIVMPPNPAPDESPTVRLPPAATPEPAPTVITRPSAESAPAVAARVPTEAETSPTAITRPSSESTPAVAARPPTEAETAPTANIRPNSESDAPKVAVHPQEEVGATTIITPPATPARADTPHAVVTRPPTEAETSPTAITRPSSESAPAAAARVPTEAETSPTVITPPSSENAPAVVTLPPTHAESSPTASAHPSHDPGATTIVNRPPTHAETSPTVITSPSSEAHAPAVAARPPTHAETSPTAITRPSNGGNSSAAITAHPNAAAEHSTAGIHPTGTVDNTATAAPAPRPAPNASAAASRTQPPTPIADRSYGGFGASPGQPGRKITVPPVNGPTPIPTTATRTAARSNRSALPEAESVNHAGTTDARVAAARAETLTRARASRDRSLELLREGKPIDDTTAQALREDLASLGVQKSLEARIAEARRLGVREDDIAAAIKEFDDPSKSRIAVRDDALRNLETEIVEKHGLAVIGQDEALAVRGAVVRAMTGNASPADRAFVREQVAKAQAEGKDWFAEIGKQGTMSFQDGFIPLANPEAVAALRQLGP